MRRTFRRRSNAYPCSTAPYGGLAGGLTGEAEEFTVAVMDDMLDTQQSLPPQQA